MNHTLFHQIEDRYRADFDRQIALDNIRKIYILARLGIFFCITLLVIDWVRMRNGTFSTNWIYPWLMGTHLVFALFLLPIGLIRRILLAPDGKTVRQKNRVTWLTLSILCLSMLPMAVLSILDRGTVITFGILILLTNLVINLPHRERIGLNLFCLVAILIAIGIIQQGKPVSLLINMLEVLGILVPTFVFSTMQFNLKIRQFYNERRLYEQKKLLETEQARSEALLLNILPGPVAEELKAFGKVKPRFHPQSTIMFVDFRNFTAICTRLTPEELIADLNALFGAFDRIIDNHGLERIKTIGDAYMAFGGLLEQGRDQAVSMTRAAIDIQNFLSEWNGSRSERRMAVFEARIGIHTGPIVAGVVGAQKFAFDIWGQPVNVAARMESACEPGCINISQQTYLLVQGDFDCRTRGMLPVKHLGEQEMYYVEGARGKIVDS